MRGMVAFLAVWVCGAALVSFGVGLPEMIGLMLLSMGVFVLASRRTASERADSA